VLNHGKEYFMAFVEAERTQLYLRCALFGPSGSGKTMTALRMAKGIAEKMGVRYAVIDTEARSASKYADRFKFVVNNLENKTVDGYITAMNEAYQAGYKILVIDSLSHAWRELTEEVDRITQASTSKNSFLSWGKVSPKQKRLVEAVLNFPGHIIATMRSKTEWVVGLGRNGKNVPEKLGLAPEQGKGIEYEFDLLVELNQEHQAVVTKDRTGKFQDEVKDKPGEDFGVALYDWLTVGTAAKQTSIAAAFQAQIENVPSANTKTAHQQITEAGDALVKEVADIITAKTTKGLAYFSEAEIDEARSLVSGLTPDENGINELREFRDMLSGLLAKRRKEEPAMRKAA
jgi:hypothetical protein